MRSRKGTAKSAGFSSMTWDLKERKLRSAYLLTSGYVFVLLFLFLFFVFRLSLSQRKFLLDHGRKKDRSRKEAGTTHVMSFMLLPLWFLATVAHIRDAFLHAKWKVSFSLSAGNRPEKHRCCWLMICVLNALLISLSVHHPHVQKHLHLCPFLHLRSKHNLTASRLIINQSTNQSHESSFLPNWNYPLIGQKKTRKISGCWTYSSIFEIMAYFGISEHQHWLLGVEVSTGLTPTIAHFMCSAAAVESQQE